MYSIERTARFERWLSKLKDGMGQKKVIARLARLALGHWGDCTDVGGEVIEVRIHFGPGYRVYCWQDGTTVVVALGGGDKSTQKRDIASAQSMVKMLKESS
jgi:putative addiction module killer protein